MGLVEEGGWCASVINWSKTLVFMTRMTALQSWHRDPVYLLPGAFPVSFFKLFTMLIIFVHNWWLGLWQIFFAELSDFSTQRDEDWSKLPRTPQGLLQCSQGQDVSPEIKILSPFVTFSSQMSRKQLWVTQRLGGME